MTSEFDDLEEDVMADMRGTYTETVIDHAMNPRNVGNIQDADGFSGVTGPCGDTMEIWLKIRAGTVAQTTFWTDGCGTSIAAGSMVTELAKGKALTEVLSITQQDVLDALGELPEEGMHCALLAANTLKQAIKDHLAYRKQPGRGLTGDTEVVNRDVQLLTKRNLSPGKQLGVRDKVLGRSGNC